VPSAVVGTQLIEASAPRARAGDGPAIYPAQRVDGSSCEADRGVDAKRPRHDADASAMRWTRRDGAGPARDLHSRTPATQGGDAPSNDSVSASAKNCGCAAARTQPLRIRSAVRSVTHEHMFM